MTIKAELSIYGGNFDPKARWTDILATVSDLPDISIKESIEPQGFTDLHTAIITGPTESEMTAAELLLKSFGPGNRFIERFTLESLPPEV